MAAHNTALTRSLRSLAHPISIGAVILLLVNDHILRVLWPSWWTGKLGDFAWLVFFPFVLAVPLALIVPARVKRREAMVAGIAFGLTGAMFAAMKTIPAMMEAGRWLLRTITAGPVGLRVDPTDLLALPGLVVGWCVWRQSTKSLSTSHAWTILVLGALASIANSPSSYYQINCVTLEDDGTVVAGEYYYRVLSKDGGVTWIEARQEPNESTPCDRPSDTSPLELTDPTHPEIRYRLTPEKSIEFTHDGGKTWIVDRDVSLTEAQRAYYEVRLGYFEIHPGPLNGVIDPETGNLIVAMNFDGVWTRLPDGTWLTYPTAGAADQKVRIDTPDIIFRMITIEIILGVLAAFLLAGVIGLFLGTSVVGSFILSIGTFMMVAIWFMGVIVRPALMFPTLGAGLMLGFGLPVLCLGSIITGVIGGSRIVRECGAVPLKILAGLLALPILFALPYVLWTVNTIPSYNTAMLWALALTIATSIGVSGTAWRQLRMPRGARPG